MICDIQRGGPSTGLPTKTEQSDLLQAMFGRNGEAPVPIVAPSSPADCFDAAIEAVRIATTYRTPVLLLSDGYLANGSEPWRIPDIDAAAGHVRRADHRAERHRRRRRAGVPPLPARPGDAGPPVGRPRHAGAGAPGRRHREGRRHRRHLLRPGQPRPHGAAAPGQDGRHRRHGRPARGRRPGGRRADAPPTCWCSAGGRRTGRSRRPSARRAAAACGSPRRTCAT